MLARIAIILAFIGWCFYCQNWYVCHIKQKCGEPKETVSEKKPIALAKDLRPIVFNWQDFTPITRTTFADYRDSILNGLPDGQILEIVGQYYSDEDRPDNYQNMGMARGAQLKALFSEFLPVERMLIVSRLSRKTVDKEGGLFEAATFNYLEQKDEEEAAILEIDNRIVIEFPFSSAKKEANPKVDAYLEKLAQRLSQTDEKVVITGHTDNIGSDDLNRKLGRARARHIRLILIEKGIDKNRITINSKGRSEPVASNDTEAGRRKNRRAELDLIK